MSVKPSIPRGTRDFSPEEVTRREYIVKIIKNNFEHYGFRPIETPSFEKTETLLGKYGEEGDRLIFKILNSGDFLSKVDDGLYAEKDSRKISQKITEKALRYDLTVPFARYVVQHQHELTFPFKRYQIQNVWRADRPQKGRYREFCQCDADVVGSRSLWQEVEFVLLYDSVFSKLGMEKVVIKLNNRKVLSGMAEIAGIADRFTDFTTALDKLDKIGREGVVKELKKRKIPGAAIKKLEPLFGLPRGNEEKLKTLDSLLAGSETGAEGVEELSFVTEAVGKFGISATLEVDVTLARGLDYYTGAILEVLPPGEVSIGSIGGGGRYDDLTGAFGLKGLSGIGISFGLDRIYLALETLGLFPSTALQGTRGLFVNFGGGEAAYAMRAVQALRKKGIAVELYPDTAKTGKQISYADKRQIPYVVLAGAEEMQAGTYTLKDLKTGEQEQVTLEKMVKVLS